MGISCRQCGVSAAQLAVLSVSAMVSPAVVGIWGSVVLVMLLV